MSVNGKKIMLKAIDEANEILCEPPASFIPSDHAFDENREKLLLNAHQNSCKY